MIYQLTTTDDNYVIFQGEDGEFFEAYLKPAEWKRVRHYTPQYFLMHDIQGIDFELGDEVWADLNKVEAD